MKTKFPEYYPLEDARLQDIWQNATIVLDTNVLLNLYRYTQSTQQDLLKLLTKCQSRLWMPYQVCLEFHRNREGVLVEKENEFDTMSSRVNTAKAEFLSKLNLKDFQRHPYFRGTVMDDKVNSFVDGLQKEIATWKDEYSKIRKNDFILEQLLSLYNGKIGEDYPELELAKIYSEGKERYSKEIPPGFGDLKEKEKKGDRHLYGDLIIWKEVMDYVNSQGPKPDVIYVTDDNTKKDWFARPHGKTTGPLPALLKEFETQTDKEILILTADYFILKAKEYLLQDMKTDTIQEVEKMSQEELEEKRRRTKEILDAAQQNLLEKTTMVQPHTITTMMPSAHPLTSYMHSSPKSHYLFPGQDWRDIQQAGMQEPIISEEIDAKLRQYGIDPRTILQNQERTTINDFLTAGVKSNPQKFPYEDK